MPRKIGVSTYSENFQGCDFTDEELAFLKAIAAYQKRWNRRFPTWREALHVLKCLGYRKVAAPIPFDTPGAGEAELIAAMRAELKRSQSEPA